MVYKICIKWKDTRDVQNLSTVHFDNMKSVNVNFKGKFIKKYKLITIIDYDKIKTGIDHGNQLVIYHLFKRKTLKQLNKYYAC